MPKKPSKQKSNTSAYLVLLIILLIIIVVLCIILFGGKKDAPPDATVPSAAPATPAPPRDTPPGSQPVQESETPVPGQTAQPPEPGTQPPIETREPLETDEPSGAGSVDVSGAFASDTGTYLNLLVKWTAKGAGDSVKLHAELYAQSYSLYTVAAYGNLELIVNGETFRGDCPIINCEGRELTETLLDSFDVEVPQGETSIAAVWHFKGSYSGKELESITASENVYIG